MGFESKFYSAAETQLSLIKQRNANLLAQREREIAEKHPEIIAIQRKLGATTAGIISLIGSGVEEFEARVNEIEAENLSLQASLKAKLRSFGYPENYLDMPYSCGICKDTGINGNSRCSCYMDMVKKAAAEELNRSSPMKLSSFGEFSLNYYDDSRVTDLGVTAREVMEETLRVCKEYAEDFHIPYKNLFLHGKTGLGKTHLSLSIASAVLEKGYSVIYGSAADLFRKIEKEQFNRNYDGPDTLEALETADLLILDDVGAEFETKFYTSALYNILNNRMNASLPTIISSNLEEDEIKERYGERIMSRILTMTNLDFAGSDIRVIKNINM